VLVVEGSRSLLSCIWNKGNSSNLPLGSCRGSLGIGAYRQNRGTGLEVFDFDVGPKLRIRSLTLEEWFYEK
jgi:hypothetical protein